MQIDSFESGYKPSDCIYETYSDASPESQLCEYKVTKPGTSPLR